MRRTTTGAALTLGALCLLGPASAFANECDVGPATRGMGFWKNHPDAVAQCLEASGGSFDLGYTMIADEVFDDDIDVDDDTKVEDALSLAMGVLKANPDKWRDGTPRSDLDAARTRVGRHAIAAHCSQVLLGAPCHFGLAEVAPFLSSSNIRILERVKRRAEHFSESMSEVGLCIDPGPTDSLAPWDDPLDPTD